LQEGIMNTIRSRILLVAVAITAFAAPVPGQVSALLEEAMAVQQFQSRTADYVALHRLLEGPLPPPPVSNDLHEVRANMAALATRITAARKDARQGDIITPDIARVFRRRIATCLPADAWEAILAEHLEDTPTPVPTLRANAPWPDDAPFNFVPPQLLQVLPAIPPELQYRIIGRALVLWDHHANLVVDFLPGAFRLTT
jgi:hypothetical protein